MRTFISANLIQLVISWKKHRLLSYGLDIGNSDI